MSHSTACPSGEAGLLGADQGPEWFPRCLSQAFTYRLLETESPLQQVQEPFCFWNGGVLAISTGLPSSPLLPSICTHGPGLAWPAAPWASEALNPLSAPPPPRPVLTTLFYLSPQLPISPEKFGEVEKATSISLWGEEEKEPTVVALGNK